MDILMDEERSQNIADVLEQKILQKQIDEANLQACLAYYYSDDFVDCASPKSINLESIEKATDNQKVCYLTDCLSTLRGGYEFSEHDKLAFKFFLSFAPEAVHMFFEEYCVWLDLDDDDNSLDDEMIRWSQYIDPEHIWSVFPVAQHESQMSASQIDFVREKTGLEPVFEIFDEEKRKPTRTGRSRPSRAMRKRIKDDAESVETLPRNPNEGSERAVDFRPNDKYDFKVYAGPKFKVDYIFTPKQLERCKKLFSLVCTGEFDVKILRFSFIQFCKLLSNQQWFNIKDEEDRKIDKYLHFVMQGGQLNRYDDKNRIFKGVRTSATLTWCENFTLFYRVFCGVEKTQFARLWKKARISFGFKSYEHIERANKKIATHQSQGAWDWIWGAISASTAVNTVKTSVDKSFDEFISSSMSKAIKSIPGTIADIISESAAKAVNYMSEVLTRIKKFLWSVHDKLVSLINQVFNDGISNKVQVIGCISLLIITMCALSAIPDIRVRMFVILAIFGLAAMLGFVISPDVEKFMDKYFDETSENSFDAQFDFSGMKEIFGLFATAFSLASINQIMNITCKIRPIFYDIKEFFKDVIDWIWKKYSGEHYYPERKDILAIDTWLKEVFDLINKPDFEQNYMVHYGYSQKVIELHNRSANFQQTILNLKLAPSKNATLLKMLEKISNYSEEIRYKSDIYQKRAEPVCLMMTGNPGEGKSASTLLFPQAVYERCKKLRPDWFLCDYSSHQVFPRIVTSPFWEGYKNQFCYSQEEWLATKVTDKRADQAVEFLNMISSSVYALDMAFKDKGKVFFCSPFVMITTNVTVVDQVSIENPNALKRRMHIKPHVTIKNKVADEVTQRDEAWNFTISYPYKGSVEEKRAYDDWPQRFLKKLTKNNQASCSFTFSEIAQLAAEMIVAKMEKRDRSILKAKKVDWTESIHFSSSSSDDEDGDVSSPSDDNLDDLVKQALEEDSAMEDTSSLEDLIPKDLSSDGEHLKVPVVTTTASTSCSYTSDIATTESYVFSDWEKEFFSGKDLASIETTHTPFKHESQMMRFVDKPVAPEEDLLHKTWRVMSRGLSYVFPAYNWNDGHYTTYDELQRVALEVMQNTPHDMTLEYSNIRYAVGMTSMEKRAMGFTYGIRKSFYHDLLEQVRKVAQNFNVAYKGIRKREIIQQPSSLFAELCPIWHWAYELSLTTSKHHFLKTLFLVKVELGHEKSEAGIWLATLRQKGIEWVGGDINNKIQNPQMDVALQRNLVHSNYADTMVEFRLNCQMAQAILKEVLGTTAYYCCFALGVVLLAGILAWLIIKFKGTDDPKPIPVDDFVSQSTSKDTLARMNKEMKLKYEHQSVEKGQLARMKNTEVLKFQSGAIDNANNQINQIANNMRDLRFVKSDGTSFGTHCLFTSRRAWLEGHFFAVHGTVFQYVDIFNGDVLVKRVNGDDVRIVYYTDQGKDYAHVDFPTTILALPSLDSRICDEDVTIDPQRWSVTRLSRQSKGGCVTIMGTNVSQVQLGAVSESTIMTPTGNSIRVRISDYMIGIGGAGTEGDCALPYVAVDFKTGRVYLLGLHIGRCNNDAYYHRIRRTDLPKDVAFVPQSGKPVIANGAWLPSCVAEPAIERKQAFDGRLISMGTVKGDFIPTDTNIIRSDFQGNTDIPPIFPITMAPAQLKPYTKVIDATDEFPERLEVVRPLQKAIEKMTSAPVRCFPKLFLRKAKKEPEMVYRGFFPNRRREFRMLKMEEALEMLDQSTSVGFDMKSLGITSRHELWTKDEDTGKVIYINPILKKAVNDIFMAILQGKEPKNVVSACLKDETRDLQRVWEGKTRIFCVGSLAHLVATVMTLGDVVSFMKENRATSDVMIGTNPHGWDWTQMCQTILKFGPNSKFGGGDFSNYDSSIQSEFAYLLYDALKKYMQWYKPQELRILFCICMSAIAPAMVISRECYFTDWMNASGNWLTGFLNSFVNKVIVNLFFWKVSTENNLDVDVDEVLVHKVYGDDNIWAIHPSIAHCFNMRTLGDFIYEYFGMTYTLPDKKEITAEFLEFEELSFLCRKLDRAIPARAPLDEESIHGMLLWIKKPGRGVSEERQLSINCEQASMEYFHYGPQIFQERVDRIREYCRIYKIPFTCKTYEYYFDRWYSQFK
jgi:hypothetical protein